MEEPCAATLQLTSDLGSGSPLAEALLRPPRRESQLTLLQLDRSQFLPLAALQLLRHVASQLAQMSSRPSADVKLSSAMAPQTLKTLDLSSAAVASCAKTLDRLSLLQVALKHLTCHNVHLRGPRKHTFEGR